MLGCGDFRQWSSLLGSLINRTTKARYAGNIPLLFGSYLFQLIVIDSRPKRHLIQVL
jgi:hypothetical protein